MCNDFDVNYVELEQPRGAEPPIGYCPICGQPSITFNEEGYGEYSPCAHLEFTYNTTAGELGYRTEEFESKIFSLEENIEGEAPNFSINNLPQVLERMGYGKELLVLAIEFSGMACGPMADIAVFGYNFDNIEVE